MSTPDPMASIFSDYTDDTTAEVAGDAPDPLWRKAKRRRIGRVAVAGAAALALIAPATWLLANAGDGDEQEQQQAAEDHAISPEEDRALDLFGPGVDIVGTVMTLPSFVPGNADVDEVCAADGTVIGDGRYEEPVENGAVFFVQDTASNLSQDGTDDFHEVGLFGCRYGEETLYQAVTLAETEDDTWVAGEQLVHSEPGGESPQYLIATERDGLVVGFAERYDPTADDLRYWAENIALDTGGAPVRTALAELDTDGFSELTVEVTSEATEEPGIWTVSLEIRNTGPRTVLDHVVYASADGGVQAVTGAPVSNRDQDQVWLTVAEIDGLAPGQVYTQEWTVSVDEPVQPWYLDGPEFHVGVESVVRYEEQPDAVQTLIWGQNGGWCGFAE